MRSQRNEIRVILFDVGGVLVELSGLAKLLSWLGHRVTPEQARTLWLTSPTVRLFETGKMQPSAFAQQMITELSLRVDSEEFLTELYIRSQRIMPGVLRHKLLSAPRAGPERSFSSLFHAHCRAIDWGAEE